MTLSDLRAYLSVANVAAFLRVIRERESGQTDDAYTILNGGAHFFSFADHPYKGQRTPPGKAAGAYQFIASTWGDVQQQYGMPDFSAASQDAGAVARLVYRKALDDVIAGRFEDAVAKCRLEWTSLPGAAESSGAWTLAKALAVYQKWGGALAPTSTRPPAATQSTPNQGRGKTMGALLTGIAGPLLQAVFERFAPQSRAQIEQAAAKATDEDAKTTLGEGLLAVLTKVTGLTDPLQAAAAVTANNPDAKAKLAAVEQGSLAYLDQIAPLLDKVAQYEQARWKAVDESADKAATRGQKDKVDLAPTLVKQSGYAFAVAAIAVLGLLALQMSLTKTGPDPTLTGFLGILIYGVVRMMDRPSAYRFGGAFESDATATGNKAINQALDERRANGGK